MYCKIRSSNARCGRLQGHMDKCIQGEGIGKQVFFADVLYGWPKSHSVCLSSLTQLPVWIIMMCRLFTSGSFILVGFASILMFKFYFTFLAESKVYHVVVKLNEPYNEQLRFNKTFEDTFRQQVQLLVLVYHLISCSVFQYLQCNVVHGVLVVSMLGCQS